MHGSAFILDLAIVLGVGAVIAVLARLARQPSILGYLLAGLVVGPYVPVPLFAETERVTALAEFGVVLVMFAVGLEFRIARLLRVLPISGVTGLVQVCFLIWCGFSLGQIVGWGTVDSLFLGASICISSTMVVSRVFSQLGRGRRGAAAVGEVREYVFGILVVQDVIAIVLIATMTAIAAGKGLALGEMASTLGRLGAVLTGILVVGLLLVPRLVRAVARLDSPEIMTVVAVGLCFGVAVLAEEMGYSVALGAFIAGMLVAESGRGQDIEHLIAPVRDMFAAIFFVSIGMTVDPAQAFAHLPLSLVIFATVVLAQFCIVSVAGVVSGNGMRHSITAALSLGQIGEFAFIIAGVGLAAGVVRPELQPILVTVAVLTTFTTSLCLGAAERVLGMVDRLMPERLRHLLTLYEEWWQRSRALRAAGHRADGWRRSARVLIIDGLALIAVLALAFAWAPTLVAWLGAYAGWSPGRARLAVILATGVISAPLMFGFAKNVVGLARRVSDALLPVQGEPTLAVILAARGLRAMVYLAVLLAAGLPTMAVLRPIIGTPYAFAVFLVVLAWLGTFLWRTAGRMEPEYRSNVDRIAEVLARQAAEDTEHRRIREIANLHLLPGLDHSLGVSLTAESYAVGKTLAELDLRARTGATVLAIQHATESVSLPTGHERLGPGDLLALNGTPEAVERACALLLQGPEAEPAGAPAAESA